MLQGSCAFRHDANNRQFTLPVMARMAFAPLCPAARHLPPLTSSSCASQAAHVSRYPTPFPTSKPFAQFIRAPRPARRKGSFHASTFSCTPKPISSKKQIQSAYSSCAPRAALVSRYPTPFSTSIPLALCIRASAPGASKVQFSRERIPLHSQTDSTQKTNPKHTLRIKHLHGDSNPSFRRERATS